MLQRILLFCILIRTLKNGNRTHIGETKQSLKKSAEKKKVTRKRKHKCRTTARLLVYFFFVDKCYKLFTEEIVLPSFRAHRFLFFNV